MSGEAETVTNEQLFELMQEINAKLDRVQKNELPWWHDNRVWDLEQCFEYLGCKRARFYQLKRQYHIREAGAPGKFFSLSIKRAKEKIDKGLKR
jgi:hypothetical protein